MRPPLQRSVGLARALSKLGYCSRAQAAELIRAGRVQVNRRVRRDPESPTHDRDRILVDGKPVSAVAPVYIMLNKPRGLVTTRSDEKGRATIYDCLGGPHLASVAKCGEYAPARSAELPWLAPVGRLDQASEGLLLMTNDSEWAARIADPAEHLDKTYHVQIDRVGDDELIRRILEGVLEDVEAEPETDLKTSHAERSSRSERSRSIPASARMLRAKFARLLRHGEKNSWIEIVLDEGRNRQIRRMLDALDIEVLRLIRVSIGPLQLGDLAKGCWRELTEKEKRAIDRALSPSIQRR